MPRDYTLHYNAIATATEQMRAAKVKLTEQRTNLRKAAIDEARAALSEAGIIVGETILTLKGRWPYQEKPIIVRSLTCWSTPVELGQGWHFQAHYFRVKRDGTRDERFADDYDNVAVPHPSEIASKLLTKMPKWQNDPTYPARAAVVVAQPL